MTDFTTADFTINMEWLWKEFEVNKKAAEQ